jgi:Cytosine deaminase and related metal-dependent hydrolases
MSSILIKGALIGDATQDLLIVDNLIDKIGVNLLPIDEDTEILDGRNKAVVPGLCNGHTHCAMTLFRGYGDDLPLQTWLEEYIWPVEAHMTEEDIYIGALLGCIEMIKSGTTCFLDMYTAPEATARAVLETGIRANLSYTLFDRGDVVRAQLDRDNCYRYKKLFAELPERISWSVGPHAIYTVSGEQLHFAKEFAEEYSVPIHLHLSETEREVKDCITEHGTTPVRYLKEIDALSPNCIMAHSLWLDDEELDILARHRCTLVHNPASNMKLASGERFRYEEMKKRGIPVAIGTDGCSSSNDLDMYIAMRMASLLGKVWRYDPTAVCATDVYHSATEVGYAMLGLKGGRIAEGYLADLCLIDLETPSMVPCHNLTSNLVYAGSSSIVSTTIVDGVLLMQDRVIVGADKIIEMAHHTAYVLLHRNCKG